MSAAARPAEKLAPAPAAAAVTDARVRAESDSGQNWLVPGANFGQTHFSPLKSLTPQNVAQLGLAWSLDVDSTMGLAMEPIEVDGTMFLSTSGDRVLAIDAESGHVRWTRAAKQSSRGRFADLLIASTAAANNLPLYTRNPDDFRALQAIVKIIAI